jgi:hypothetical protein
LKSLGAAFSSSNSKRRAMPRANRHFLPGHLWHITHRCH